MRNFLPGPAALREVAFGQLKPTSFPETEGLVVLVERSYRVVEKLHEPVEARACNCTLV